MPQHKDGARKAARREANRKERDRRRERRNSPPSTDRVRTPLAAALDRDAELTRNERGAVDHAYNLRWAEQQLAELLALPTPQRAEALLRMVYDYPDDDSGNAEGGPVEQMAAAR